MFAESCSTKLLPFFGFIGYQLRSNSAMGNMIFFPQEGMEVFDDLFFTFEWLH
jgi:hypothetical protein